MGKSAPKTIDTFGVFCHSGLEQPHSIFISGILNIILAAPLIGPDIWLDIASENMLGDFHLGEEVREINGLAKVVLIKRIKLNRFTGLKLDPSVMRRLRVLERSKMVRGNQEVSRLQANFAWTNEWLV